MAREEVRAGEGEGERVGEIDVSSGGHADTEGRGVREGVGARHCCPVGFITTGVITRSRTVNWNGRGVEALLATVTAHCVTRWKAQSNSTSQKAKVSFDDTVQVCSSLQALTAGSNMRELDHRIRSDHTLAERARMRHHIQIIGNYR